MPWIDDLSAVAGVVLCAGRVREVVDERTTMSARLMDARPKPAQTSACISQEQVHHEKTGDSSPAGAGGTEADPVACALRCTSTVSAPPPSAPRGRTAPTPPGGAHDRGRPARRSPGPCTTSGSSCSGSSPRTGADDRRSGPCSRDPADPDHSSVPPARRRTEQKGLPCGLATGCRRYSMDSPRSTMH
jgi:hypothetical protein